MATLKIYNPDVQAKEPASLDVSGATLPLSLAHQEGKAISTIGQAFADIVNSIGERQDENRANELSAQIDTKVSTEYNKYSSTSDIKNGPINYEKALSPKSKFFKKLIKNENKRVQRLLTDELNLNKRKYLGQLITNISENVADKFLLSVDVRANLAISNVLSGDLSAIGTGETNLNRIFNNKTWEEAVGAKKWNEWVKNKKLQLLELQVERDNKFNPESTIANREKLEKIFGLDKAKAMVEDAENKLVSKMAESANAAVIEELKDNDDKVAVFTEFLLRLKIIQESDETMEQDLPTVSDLQDALDEGLITEPMFNALSHALISTDKITDRDVWLMVTEHMASAKSVQMLNDFKLAVSTDPRILTALNIGDLTLVHNLIDGAKKDFPAHKETQHYLTKIKAHYKNLSGNKDTLGIVQELESKKVDLERNYLELVGNGYSAKKAYIDTIRTEFDQNAIPSLNNLEQPKYLKDTPDYLKQITEKGANVYFRELYDGALEAFENHKNHLQFQTDINRIDMIEKMFWLRYNATPPDEDGKHTHEHRINWAATADTQTSGGAYAWD